MIVAPVVVAVLWIAGHEVWSVLAAFTVLAVYVAQCVFWPFGRCWMCKGSGRWYKNEKRKNFRDCWWCKGAGRRLRIVRRIYNRMHTVKKKAH
jgi:hypothetical protein